MANTNRRGHFNCEDSNVNAKNNFPSPTALKNYSPFVSAEEGDVEFELFLEADVADLPVRIHQDFGLFLLHYEN